MTARARHVLPAPVGLACALLPAAAWGFDAEVRSDTQAQAYQLRGPAGATVLSMRRLTETLTLTAVERPAHSRGVTWTLRARLRVDSDFGTSCDPTTDRCLDELNRSRAVDFAPLFARRTLDLPYAWLEGAGLFRGTTDLRVGRQLIADPLGFFLFDGARARVHATPHVVFEAYGGLETRSGFPLSNGRYERDGIQRIDRTGWSPTIAARVQDRASAVAAAFAAEVAVPERFFARATWRRVWGDDGTAEEKLGLVADVDLSRAWRAYGEAVHSIPQQMLANLVVGAVWSGEHGASARFKLSRWRPTFDLTSIWASFWIDPTDDARLRAELPLGRGFTLVAGAQARRYALSESPASPSSVALPDAWCGGGDVGVVLRRGRYDAQARGHGEGGELGARGGIDLSGQAWLRWQVLRLDASVSAWIVDDQLRPDRSVASLGLVLGALLRVGRIADIALSFEDDINRIVGHRLRAVAMLTVRTPY